MGIRGIRTIKLAAAVPVALAVTLAAPAAIPRLSTSATAAPVTAADPKAADDIKPDRLKRALLTADQLPKGYQSVPFGDGASLFSGVYDRSTIGGDPCDALRQLVNTPPPTVGVPQPKSASGGSPPAPRGASSSRGMSTASLTLLPSGRTTAAQSHIPVQAALFVTDGPGPIVVQSLADLGRRWSRDQVRNTEQMLLRCPEARLHGFSFTATPLWTPQLGDRSVALDFTVKFSSEGPTSDSVDLYGQSLVVAYKNVSMNLVTGSIRQDDIKTAQLMELAKSAMHNLRKANW
ncbi:hypothetical protein [Actinoplanes siamensis]|uniref:Secreted protein n=2 Tax=Actinoplanes siamensis TaxID=1223317 RepID=A0A919N9V3_9ACTN|nr:hypothetical protein Asi03nite_44220 [Actinoplanes siamensis]